MRKLKKLRELLIRALSDTLEALRRNHPGDSIRAFGILAGIEGDTIEPFFHLQSQLEHRARTEGSHSQPEFFVVEAPDPDTTAPYGHLFHEATEYSRNLWESAGDDSDLDEMQADIHATMLDAIRAFDRKGAFGTVAERNRVFLFLHTLEMAESEIEDFARQLNPQDVMDWALGPIARPQTTGQLLPVGKIGSCRYDNMSITPDGRILAISGWSGSYRIWDTGDFSKERTRYSTWKIDFTSCALTCDGSALYLAWRQAYPEERGILEAHTSQSKRKGAFPTHGRAVWGMAAHPLRKLLATGEEDGHIHLWEYSSTTPVQSLHAHSGTVRSIVFSPDGTKMFSGAREDGIRAWDTKTWDPIWQSDHPIEELALSPDGSRLACVNFGDVESQIVHMRNSRTGEIALSLQLQDGSAPHGDDEFAHLHYGADCVAFSRDGGRVAIGLGFGEGNAHTRLYDAISGAKLASCHSEHEHVSGVCFLPDNQTIAITGKHHRGAALYLWIPGI